MGGVNDPKQPARTLKEIVDAYGVAVRAGSITPTLEDEEIIRNLFEILPSVNEDIKKSWSEDGNVRKPITLKIEEKPL